MPFVIRYGVFHFYDFTPVNVHDVNSLNDIKLEFKSSLFIGDRGYISKQLQVDLFNYSNNSFICSYEKESIRIYEIFEYKSKKQKKN